MNSTVQFVSILILLLVLATYLILTQTIRRRRRALALRPIAAYNMLPLLVGEAIEADRPIHVSIGSSGVGGDNTILTLAAVELAYQVAQRAAIGTSVPMITTNETSTLPLAHGILQRAYGNRDLLERYRANGARWYPSGAQSLAFAAALTTTLGDERVATNVLAGNFGPELALVLDAAHRRRLPSIATSASPEGQAVAYALSDYPLIGEEVFTAGGYLGESASQGAVIATQDVLRGLLILLILIPMLDALTNGALLATLGRLIGAR